MQIRHREIHHYTTPSGHNPFRRWYTNIKDQKTQIAITNRISRLRIGNFGDFKRLNKDLYELRIHYGPGYRIYFGVYRNDIVIPFPKDNLSLSKQVFVVAQFIAPRTFSVLV